MKLFGLIGHPLQHSFSKQYFNNKFINENIKNVAFENFDIQNIEQVQQIFKLPHLTGLAVTIPYKKHIINYLNECDEISTQINACNCIAIQNNKLIGYNTDVIGFKKSFEKHLQPHHTKALVLGNGGAAQAVQYVLRQLNISYTTVTRQSTPQSISYAQVNQQVINTHHIIINTTPLGTFPHINQCANIPYQHLTPKHYLFDMVYNPSATMFMNKGLQQNAIVQNGYEMLCIQAEENWKIWEQIP